MTHFAPYRRPDGRSAGHLRCGDGGSSELVRYRGGGVARSHSIAGSTVTEHNEPHSAMPRRDAGVPSPTAHGHGAGEDESGGGGGGGVQAAPQGRGEEVDIAPSARARHPAGSRRRRCRARLDQGFAEGRWKMAGGPGPRAELESGRQDAGTRRRGVRARSSRQTRVLQGRAAGGLQIGRAHV